MQAILPYLFQHIDARPACMLVSVLVYLRQMSNACPIYGRVSRANVDDFESGIDLTPPSSSVKVAGSCQIDVKYASMNPVLSPMRVRYTRPVGL